MSEKEVAIENVDKSKSDLKTYVFEKEYLLYKKITVQTDCWDSAYEMANSDGKKSFDDSHTYHETDMRPVIDFRWNPTIRIECLTKLAQNGDPS